MTDPLLRRLERNAVAACLAMAAVGGLWAGPPALLGVLGGGLLAAVSYASIASGVTALTDTLRRVSPAGAAPAGPAGDASGGDGADVPERPPRRSTPGARTLGKVVLRYALLILLAYVMIARLRLHPVGVLAGLSSVVAAVGVEAVRILVKKS